MPELPEVEVLCRHLATLLHRRTIRAVEVRRAKILAPTGATKFRRALTGTRFLTLARRGKYLVFTLQPSPAAGRSPFLLVGHLGMTGRLFVVKKSAPLPKHTAVVFDLGPHRLVFEDPRAFGRLTLDTAALGKLGPEPLGDAFTPAIFAAALRRSSQAIKVKLLDQSLVSGVGNIYASESLFRARLSPRRPARRLKPDEIHRLWKAVRDVLAEAIAWGSTLPVRFDGGASDGLFYFGRTPGVPAHDHERLLVYDRAGQPCVVCRTLLRRIVQAARSTFFCPKCQA
jgi:formamidopyrimidine-DNA glycosylase